LCEPFAQPTIGEPTVVEPGVAQFVQDNFRVEVLADFQLVAACAEPAGVAIEVWGVRLAYLNWFVDWPGLAD